jgi:hypothetical protein
MRPDEICREYSERTIKLRIRNLKDVVLVEGTAEALEFLGKLFLAQSRAQDDGFEIAPNGPGEYFFDRASEKGVYIHRLDE